MSEPEPPKSAREPRALSAEYHKAHKQLMLWSAILFIWEFVGIDLEKAKDTEGYVGALVKSLKSPQAVPWVLLALVLYFLFKCSTEWAQCHQHRRRLKFARADFGSGWIVALAGIALYFAQALSHVQFADIINNPGVRVVLIWSINGLIVGILIAKGSSGFYTTWKKTGRLAFNGFLKMLLAFVVLMTVLYRVAGRLPSRMVFFGLFLGASLGTLLPFLIAKGFVVAQNIIRLRK